MFAKGGRRPGALDREQGALGHLLEEPRVVG
jgi:hypothetical protein